MHLSDPDDGAGFRPSDSLGRGFDIKPIAEGGMEGDGGTRPVKGVPGMDGKTESAMDAAWFSTIQSMGRRLGDFSSEVEQTFLTISAQIKEFSDRTKEITRMSLGAAGAMGGDEISGAIGGIRDMVDKLRVLFQETETQTEDRLGSLTRIEADLARVGDDLDALLETARNLRMLGLSTKIQSTRTGGNMGTFMQLGEDISKMSGVILGKGEELAAQAARLSEIVGQVLSGARTLRGRQVKQTSGVLLGARQVVDSLQDISRSSQEESKRILHWSREIEGNISQLVVSVQYHDITRQALEKIHHDLRLLADPKTARNDGSGQHAGVQMAWACRQQAACLREVTERLVGAVRSMIEGFSGITVNIADMAHVTSQASGAASRFLDQLQKGMGSVTSFLAEVVESGKEMSGSMNTLAGTVEGMSAFTQDIEMISSDVELISLNARIKAAQTGTKGAGMGVIAGAVHTAASESNAYRKAFLEKLLAITREAETLREKAEDDARGEAPKLDVVVRELGVLLDALRIMQERIISILGAMEREGRELSRLIDLSLQEIKLHVRAETFLEDITRELDWMAQEALALVPVAELAAITRGRVPVETLSQATASEKVRILDEHLTEDLRGGGSGPISAEAGKGDVVLF